MTVHEIRLRRMAQQHLLQKADKMTVVRNLCGVQAQFLGNAMHSLKIRCLPDDQPTSFGLVKNWTVRGTVHVLAEEDLPLFITREIYRVDDWSIPCFWNRRPDWALTPLRQTELSRIILSALENGALTREELKELCRRNGMTEAEEGSMFHPWGGGIRQLCERGFMHGVVSEEKAYCLTKEFLPLSAEEAGLELACRYFTHMGPATIHDAMYFFGAKAAQVKKWLKELPVTETECEGRRYYHIETETGVEGEIPRCVFLAGFDQLLLGYEKKESLILSEEHLRRIFNLAGIVMPAVLLDGVVAGRWKKTGRKLKVELFSPQAPSVHHDIRKAAETLWSGELSGIVIEE